MKNFKKSILLIPLLLLCSCNGVNNSSIDSSSNKNSNEIENTFSSSISSTNVNDSSSSQNHSSDTSTSSSDTSSTDSSDTSPVVTVTPDVFISEYFKIGYNKDNNPTGNNNDNAIELFNPTENDIVLENYRIEIYKNGESEPNQANTISFTSSDIIKAKSTFLLVNTYAQESLKKIGDKVCNVYVGPKTPFTLVKENQTVDVFGYIGRYVENADIEIDNVVSATSDHNVYRKSGITSNTTFTESEWKVGYNYNFSTLGIHYFEVGEVDPSDVLNELVEKYQSMTFTNDGKEIEWIKEYKGFKVEYTFYDFYFGLDGKIKEYPNETDFFISFYIKFVDEEGSKICESWDPYITYIIEESE